MTRAKWHPLILIAFRFISVYLLLFNFQSVLQFVCNALARVPFVHSIPEHYDNLWRPLITWVGLHVLHVHQPLIYCSWSPADATYGYVWTFCDFLIAVVATAFWSMLDPKRTNYDRLHQWLRLYIRVCLSLSLLSYGMDKIFPNQFPAIDLLSFDTPVRDLSPMRLLWIFMGFSPSYTAFGGWAEVIPGILLFIPRLTLLAACISAGVMTNVFLLNAWYDVRVKQFSLHLLFMAIVLIVPDLMRLANLFVFNRNAEPARSVPLFRKAWLNRCALAAQVLLGVYMIGTYAHSSWQQTQTRSSNVKQPLYGIWDVDQFFVDGKEKPPLATDAQRWQRLIFQYRHWVIIRGMGETVDGAYVSPSQDGKTLSIGTVEYDPDKDGENVLENPKWKLKSEMTVAHPTPDKMVLQGLVKGKMYLVKLHRIDESKYRINSSRFRWISDPPYNN
jgi:uncharacterized membrane protein YphA (DoxX/SURF4 family)